jgi:hypothetical protein
LQRWTRRAQVPSGVHGERRCNNRRSSPGSPRLRLYRARRRPSPSRPSPAWPLTQFHTDEASRWDYRIEIAYKDVDASKHEEEIAQELFKDPATRKREENRRWELTVNHWDLPIYQVDTTKPR